jgi:hypothetical protein
LPGVSAPTLTAVTVEIAVTVKVAEAVVPVPPLVEVTALVVLLYVFPTADVTFTLITQGVPTATVAPLILTTPVPAVSVNVAPVQPVSLPPLGVDITRPLGNVSEMATPVRLTVSGLVIVIVKSELAAVLMPVGVKVLLTVGGLLTIRFALAVNPVPPLVELTVPVVLVAVPAVVSVTLAVIVQLELTGIDAPLRLTLVAVTPPPVKVPPEHVVVAAVEIVIPVGNVSLTATPD